MADQPSSSSAPYFVLSDLLSIPNPTCTAAADSACLKCDQCQTAHLLHKLKTDVSDINSSLENLNIFGQDLCRHLKPLVNRVTEEKIRPEDVCDLLDEPQFRQLIRAVKHFKLHLPYTSYFDLGDEYPRRGNRDRHHVEPYDNLTDNEKKCLFCCSVFDSEIKRRVLINWWRGEKLLDDSIANSEGKIKTLEEAGEYILKRLQENHFINRVQKNKRATDTWLMEQPVRLFVRSKAKDEKFFDFHERIISEKVMLLKFDNQIDPLLDRSMANKVQTVFNVDRLLIGENEGKILSLMKGLRVLHLGRSTPREKQHIRVKNLNLIVKQLKKMKQLRLLSLQGISTITKLSDSVCKLKHLMVLDLRACQALESLPSGIGNLKSLIYLDMSGCYILMPLPKELCLLVNLEVLKGFVIGTEPIETSKSCNLHDLRMLKKLHKLSIYVLKKYFPQHQDLKDLANIEGLVKLKIVWNPAASNVLSDQNGQGQASGDLSQEVHQQENANEIQMDQGMDIAGQGSTIQNQHNAVPEITNLDLNEPVLQNSNKALNIPAEISRHWSTTMFNCCFRTHLEEENSTKVLEKLEKLDLWFVPEQAALMLLTPKNFTNTLKKLYVRWAKFQHLNYNQDAEKWDVQMLRLLFLPNLEMSWEELDGLFPKLSYLEVLDCPNLQFHDYLDDEGVWQILLV